MHCYSFLQCNSIAFQGNDDNPRTEHVKVTMYVPLGSMAAENLSLFDDPNTSQDSLSDIRRTHIHKLEIVLQGAINIKTEKAGAWLQL